MGLFQNKPEEQKMDWAGLPSEPLDPENPAETLEQAPAVDPFAVTLPQTSTVALPAGPHADSAGR